MKKLIPNRISHFRKKIKWTQLRLSQELGVTENTIANWERGQGIEWLERAIKLCVLFDCHIQDLQAETPYEMEDTSSKETPDSLDKIHRDSGLSDISDIVDNSLIKKHN